MKSEETHLSIGKSAFLNTEHGKVTNKYKLVKEVHMFPITRSGEEFQVLSIKPVREQTLKI